MLPFMRSNTSPRSPAANTGPKRRTTQVDVVSVDKDLCRRFLDINAVIFTGETLGLKENDPLFILPEVAGVQNLTADDYSHMMEYLLNKLIIQYQNNAATQSRDKISLLIDRKSYGYGEAAKICNGFSELSGYISRIFYIGPSRLYGIFSLWYPPIEFSGKIQFFSTLQDAEREYPQFLNDMSIPSIAGGSLICNMSDYSQKELTVLDIYLKYKAFRKESKSHGIEFMTSEVAQDIERHLARVESLMTRIKIEIHDQVDSLWTQWQPSPNDSAQHQTLYTLQNVQLMWIGGKTQEIYQNLLRNATRLRQKLSDLESGKVSLSSLEQLNSKAEQFSTSFKFYNEANWNLNQLVNSLAILKDAKEFHMRFEAELKASKAATKSNDSSVMRELLNYQQQEQSLKNELGLFESAICNNVLFSGVDAASALQSSEMTPDQLSTFKADLNSFVNEAAANLTVKFDDKLVRAVKLLATNIDMVDLNNTNNGVGAAAANVESMPLIVQPEANAGA